MSDRGMMKWAPYRSLVEQSEFLDQMRYQKNKKERPTLTEDRKEEINRVLQNYKGEILGITYYSDGYTYLIKTKIKRIDVENQQLILPEGKLKFRDIVKIENSEVL